VGVRFSAPVQTGPGAQPASCTMGTGSFPGVKRPGRGVDHPPPSSTRVKERVELYLYSPSGPSWPVLGRTLPFTVSTLCKSVDLSVSLRAVKCSTYISPLSCHCLKSIKNRDRLVVTWLMALGGEDNFFFFFLTRMLYLLFPLHTSHVTNLLISCTLNQLLYCSYLRDFLPVALVATIIIS
jgi:hypothetical protein